MRWRQESSISEGHKMRSNENAERPEQVSTILPVSDLSKSGNASPLLTNHPSLVNYNTYSETTMDDSSNADFNMLYSEAGQIYAYNWQWLLKKAKSIADSIYVESNLSNLELSHQYKVNSQTAPITFRERAYSGPILTRSKTSKSWEGKRKPKVMKYIQDFSDSFENAELLSEEVEDKTTVQYLKAEHKLDGQTYILKKQHIWVDFDQDIHEHPAYQKILEVRDNQLPLNVRYVNSWIELNNSSQTRSPKIATSGLEVILVIQMRYIGDYFKLAKDLILFTQKQQAIDEDEMDDMADDAIEEAENMAKNGLNFIEAMTNSFNKIGLQKLIKPLTLEQIIWKLWFYDTLNKA